MCGDCSGVSETTWSRAFTSSRNGRDERPRHTPAWRRPKDRQAGETQTGPEFHLSTIASWAAGLFQHSFAAPSAHLLTLAAKHLAETKGCPNGLSLQPDDHDALILCCLDLQNASAFRHDTQGGFRSADEARRRSVAFGLRITWHLNRFDFGVPRVEASTIVDFVGIGRQAVLSKELINMVATPMAVHRVKPCRGGYAATRKRDQEKEQGSGEEVRLHRFWI